MSNRRGRLADNKHCLLSAIRQCFISSARNGKTSYGMAVSERALAEEEREVTNATKLAHGALRMLGNIGIALAINAIISGITHLVNRVKEIKESTDNLISSFKSLKEEADSLAKNSNTLVSEYAKPSSKNLFYIV